MRSEFHGTGAGRESSRETVPTTSLRASAIRIQKFPRRKFFCATSEKRVAHQSSAEVRKNRNRTTTTKDAKVTKGREELTILSEVRVLRVLLRKSLRRYGPSPFPLPQKEI